LWGELIAGLLIGAEQGVQIGRFLVGERGGLVDRLVEGDEFLLACEEVFLFGGDSNFDGGERRLQLCEDFWGMRC